MRRAWAAGDSLLRHGAALRLRTQRAAHRRRARRRASRRVRPVDEGRTTARAETRRRAAARERLRGRAAPRSGLRLHGRGDAGLAGRKPRASRDRPRGHRPASTISAPSRTAPTTRGGTPRPWTAPTASCTTSGPRGSIRAIGVGANEWEILERCARDGDFDCFLLAGRYSLLEQTALEQLPADVRAPRDQRHRGRAVQLGNPRHRRATGRDVQLRAGAAAACSSGSAPWSAWWPPTASRSPPPRSSFPSTTPPSLR